MLHPANHNRLHQAYETIYIVTYNQIETIYRGKEKYKHFDMFYLSKLYRSHTRNRQYIIQLNEFMIE